MTDATVALIVDWGGVLTSPVQLSFDSWMSREDVEPESFAETMRALHNESDSPLHRVERGEVDREVLEHSLAANLRLRTGGAVVADGLLDRMFADLARNEAMRSVVRRAREGGIPTAVLSNSWGMDYDEADLCEVAGTLLLSGRMGVRKPESMSYLMAADALAVDPSVCVFVDDLGRNARGARDVGMTSIVYQQGAESQVVEILASRFGNSIWEQP